MVRKCATPDYGQDFQDSRDHEANTTTAHGATGAVVGTTNTQTLTGKSMSGATNTFTAIPTTALDGGPLSGTNFHNSVSTKVTTNGRPHIGHSGTHSYYSPARYGRRRQEVQNYG